MVKRILFLPTVFLLVLAISLWTAPTALAQQGIPLNSKNIPQFIDPLPLLALPGGPTGIPYTMAVADGTGPLTIRMCEFDANILPLGTITPGVTPTRVWGYIVGTTCPTTPQDTYIGPVILATRNTATPVTWVNALGTTGGSHMTFWKNSVDLTLHWADPINAEANACATGTTTRITDPTGFHHYYGFGDSCNGNYVGSIPAVVHLHGGEVPPGLDGGPDAWFTSDGSKRGHGYYSFGTPGNNAIYNYPNTQEAAPIWFHDHVLGITRLNVYAGLAGAYIITDPALSFPQGLTATGLDYDPINNPGVNTSTIIPLVIQDRMFDTTGQLFFPADSAGNVVWSPNPDHPYWVPEFVGDTIVVNGKAWPYLNVEPKRYRFLFLNGSNARTYELQIPSVARMYVIGTDGGYLDIPAPVKKLVIMPGERYDVIIDFAGLLPGNYIMTNSGKTPYPRGAQPQGATVGRVMQFRVAACPVGGCPPDNSYNPALGTAIRTGAATSPKIVRLPGTLKSVNLPINTTNVQKFRQLTLNEYLLPPIAVAPDILTGAPAGTAYPGGPAEVLVNNSKWMGKFNTGTCRGDFQALAAGGYNQCYSELPAEGETELWEIINLTADAHPIHLHLVQFQIVNRQNFDVAKYNTAYNWAFTNTGPGGPLPAPCVPNTYCPGYGPPLHYGTGAGTHPTYNAPILGGNPDVTPCLAKKAALPAPEEEGWKDTVVVMPGMVTRLMVRWAPTDKPVGAPSTLWFPFDPNSGHGYVWHCHIIDHEDNEMMRPTSVTPNGSAPLPRPYISY